MQTIGCSQLGTWSSIFLAKKKKKELTLLTEPKIFEEEVGLENVAAKHNLINTGAKVASQLFCYNHDIVNLARTKQLQFAGQSVT